MTALTSVSMVSLGGILISLGMAGVAEASQFFGNSEPLGQGFVRSFVTLDDKGTPQEVGITLTPGALSLPTGSSDADISTFLALPSQASTTPFNHIQLTYRPRGYPWLPPTFAVPRFTVDAFLISPQERSSICPGADINNPLATCPEDKLAQALKSPKPENIPQSFQPTGIVEPGFGARYFDTELLPPIIEGQKPFTTLYDYAFFDGQMSIIGFGGTKAFIESQTDISNPIKLPTSYAKSGYYPTGYSFSFDPASQEYKLALTGLTFRTIPEFSPTFGLLAIGVLGIVYQLKEKQRKQKVSQS